MKGKRHTTEDPNGENVAMDPDDYLPWPHLALVQKWWQASEAKFPKGARHLLGKPSVVEWLEQVLHKGRQHQRAATGVELMMLRPGEMLFNVSDPGFHQQQILGMAEVIR